MIFFGKLPRPAASSDNVLHQPRGGYVWDFKDQGLRKKCEATGTNFFAYGGDFGDTKNDAQFCINGLFFPDMVPHPAVNELRYLQQPVQLTPAACEEIIFDLDGNDHTIALNVNQRNKSFSLDDTVDWEWSIVSDEHAPSAQGSFQLYNDEPISVISLYGLKKDNFVTTMPKKYWLNVTGRVKHDTPLGKKRHIIVTEQLPIKFAGKSKGHLAKQSAETKVRTVEESTSHITISTSRHEIIFDKKNGSLVRFGSSISSKMIFTTISPNFTRADTDNDQGGKEIVRSFFDNPIIIDFAFWKCQVEKMLNLNTGLVDLNRSFSTCWHEKGLAASNPPKMKCKHCEIQPDDENNIISIKSKHVALSVKDKILMTVDSDFKVRNDALDISYSVRPSRFLHNLPSLPRNWV